ncbi:Uma2 family endonuclease [Streptomyces sp. 8N114]|uniref:Uma2 family endonuclease n=1 Tax=Streptomyces sp. 8N114 TaxID=3457419 RepID=UPI003FD3C5D4
MRARATTEEGLLLEGFMAMSIPEWCRPEFLDGEIVVKPLPPGSHEHCLGLVLDQVIWKSSTEMDFSGHKGLRLGSGTGQLPNFVIPDGTWVPRERRLFRGAKPWMPGDGVAMVAEVTSIKPERDREAKRHCYALGGIPLYLLIDRERGAVTLFSEPDNDDYQQVVTMPFGKEIALPEPFSMTLETTDFA